MPTLPHAGPGFIDIGVNLLDEQYTQGCYNHSTTPKHPPDLAQVLERAWGNNLCHSLIITAGSLDEARKALELTSEDPRLFSTVGVHPTRCKELVEAEGGMTAYLDELLDLAKVGHKTGKIVAIGECGLDYDRLHFCDAATQQAGFEAQFTLAEETGLPMFLHNRHCTDDFLSIIRKNRHRFSQGVVHTFTGPAAEAEALLGIEGLYIGLNGCSFKTEEQIEVIKSSIPLDKILLETDAPWCDIRQTHAGARFLKKAKGEESTDASYPRYEMVKKEKWEATKCVKGRNEPCFIVDVAQVVAGIHGVSLKEVEETCHRNTVACFPGLLAVGGGSDGGEEGEK